MIPSPIPSPILITAILFRARNDNPTLTNFKFKVGPYSFKLKNPVERPSMIVVRYHRARICRLNADRVRWSTDRTTPASKQLMEILQLTYEELAELAELEGKLHARCSKRGRKVKLNIADYI